MHDIPRGLYALTADRYPDAARLLDEVEAALAGGAAMVQFRDKSGDAAWRLDTARALQARCAARGVPLIVNDDVALALAVGAAGVHLGRDDGSPAAARARLGADANIGVSCYDAFDRAVEAAGAGADYVAFGSLFASPTKREAVRCDLSLLTRARALGPAVVGIGGITRHNAPEAIAAGAHALAVISALFDAQDIRREAQRFAALWPSH